MEIIFKGQHTGAELVKSLSEVMQLFKTRYQVPAFQEIHLTVTLVDEAGKEVELVDDSTEAAYRRFEVYRKTEDLHPHIRAKRYLKKPKLVVNNGPIH